MTEGVAIAMPAGYKRKIKSQKPLFERNHTTQGSSERKGARVGDHFSNIERGIEANLRHSEGQAETHIGKV